MTAYLAELFIGFIVSFQRGEHFAQNVVPHGFFGIDALQFT